MLYRTLVSPWLRMLVTSAGAELLRQLHPLRVQRYLLSDLNPWMIPVKAGAAAINNGNRRKPAPGGNPFVLWEKMVSDMIVNGLNRLRDARDAAYEQLFKTLYESPGMRMLAKFIAIEGPQNEKQLEELRRLDAARWRRHMDAGEFADAMVRIFLAVGFADQVAGRRGYAAIREVLAQSRRMQAIFAEDLRQIIREQSRILQTDTDLAIDALPRILTDPREREEARTMLRQAAAKLGRELSAQENSVLQRIRSILAD